MCVTCQSLRGQAWVLPLCLANTSILSPLGIVGSCDHRKAVEIDTWPNVEAEAQDSKLTQGPASY